MIPAEGYGHEWTDRSLRICELERFKCQQIQGKGSGPANAWSRPASFAGDDSGFVRLLAAGVSMGAGSAAAATPSLQIQWGGVIGDYPLTGDVDSDGRSDLVIYRPSNGGY